jgi:hypothetical protein
MRITPSIAAALMGFVASLQLPLLRLGLLQDGDVGVGVFQDPLYSNASAFTEDAGGPFQRAGPR